ncbi:MAG: hypothetical protein U0L49_01970 [Eubacterium sp.]|nr:hypothetical protein [Eubacterium sp.]
MKEKREITQEEFQSKLQEVLGYAAEHASEITKEEVEEFFKGMGLNRAQMKLVYAFLLSKKINVEGYQASGINQEERKREWSPEEQKFLEYFEEDLRNTPPEKEGEWNELIPRLRDGDSDAKRRAAELLLPDLLANARTIAQTTEEIQVSDILQEGSLRLVMAADQLDYQKFNGREAIRRELLRQAAETMHAAVAEQTDVHTGDRQMVEKVEDLKDGISILKEEYGRKVYLDEVADFMNISEEEAENILRLAGEEVKDEQPGAQQKKQQ